MPDLSEILESGITEAEITACGDPSTGSWGGEPYAYRPISLGDQLFGLHAFETDGKLCLRLACRDSIAPSLLSAEGDDFQGAWNTLLTRLRADLEGKASQINTLLRRL